MRKGLWLWRFAPLLFAWTVHAQAQLEPIARDSIAPVSLRRIHVVSSSASTVFDPASGNYLSAKAHDGNRQTKWVAAETPSKEKPQWIVLKFAGKQTISSVAVFGEAIGNDGILEGQIQIVNAAQTEFNTVAAITDAKSATWRTTFPATNATHVRLLVTRSSGPSPHTDVYEVEVYGAKLSAAELEKQTQNHLAEQGKLLPVLSTTNQWWNSSIAWLRTLHTKADELRTRSEKLNESFTQWNQLNEREQEKLADEIDLFSDRMQQFGEVVAKLKESSIATRIAEIKAAREIFKTAKDVTAEQRGEKRIQLFNSRVLLQFNEADNSWNAFWNGKADAAIFRGGFDVEANGKIINMENVQTDVGTFEGKPGKQISQSWGDEIRVERFLRVHDGRDGITIGGRIKNNSNHAISLGQVRPLIISPENKGGWMSGDLMNIPAAIYIVGSSEWQCAPGRSVDVGRKDEQSYGSTQVLNLTDAKSRTGFTTGFLTAFEARPDLNAHFRSGEGGISLLAQQRFLNRRLDPGESLDFDTLYLGADDDAYIGLENYADTAAQFAQQPVRTKPNALWCSWYAHRMDVSEDLVLANAAVATKYFQPLGFEIMQLDHGWQRGDITGDWVVDEKTFPHGFKWLSHELKKRYDLKLGVWIAPTDVAETSDTFRQHSDWMLKDAQGKPQVNWKWYWKPNPNCFELDASNPDAARWMENVFSRLSAEGVSYYKIDFIASSGSEHFVQQNPKITRGWSVLRGAMESVRRGAGNDAWIRYCQPPPLLSAGLADSAYGGGDTLDAGLKGDIRVLRENARSLAASYWINDRLYHREVCDMSVRMQADVEEVRMRLALMTLANTSISFSDELQFLPASRLRMMQTCLPPGNPPMKPLDLFERTIPSIWQIHCTNNADEWDAVGLFNFENVAETRTITFAELHLQADVEMLAFEFWEQKFLGAHGTNLTVRLPPQSSRIFSLRKSNGHPQVVGTDLHQLQGYHELKKLAWDDQTSRLSGECERAPGIEGKLFIYVPTNYSPHFEFPLNEKSARLTHLNGSIWAYEINFQTARVTWSIPFDRK